jgi:hypothetical protein
MITSLIDIDDQRGWSDFELGQDLLDLSMPWVSHLAEQDDGVDGVGFGLDKFKVLGSVISRWVEIED